MHVPKITIFVVFLIFSFLMINLGWAYRHAIIFALIFAGVFYPFSEILKNKFKISDNLACIGVCIGITLGLLAPFIYFAVEVTGELVVFSQFLNANQIGLFTQFLEDFYNSDGILASRIKSALAYLNIATEFEELQQNFIDFLKNSTVVAFNFMNTLLSDIIGNTFNFIVQYIVMIFFVYALLRNGKQIKIFLNRIIPLPTEIFEHTLYKFNQLNFVILVCNGLSGIIQGFIGGTLLWIVGIETVVLWGAAMAILAFIPIIGMALIYIPISIYLFISGKILFGLILFIGCFMTVFAIENIFKPKFIGRRVEINSLLLLFGILGGLSFFGAQGIFYGPIIITLFLTFVQFVNEEEFFNTTPNTKKKNEPNRKLKRN